MKTSGFQQFFFISSLAGILLFLSGRSAHAEPLPTTPQPTAASEFSSDLSPLEATTIPIPDKVLTSAASLQAETLSVQTIDPIPEPISEPAAPTVAQAVTPGRATLSGPSYVGVGANIGFGGRTDLGRGSFTIFSKIGLTNNLSARPAIAVGSEPALLLPVTVDFPVRSVANGRVGIAPYVGGGAVISTGNDSVVRALVTGGVDVPLSEEFTANAGVNVGFLGKTEVGLRLGVGYNF